MDPDLRETVVEPASMRVPETRRGQGSPVCGFRFNPAGCSDVKPATVPKTRNSAAGSLNSSRRAVRGTGMARWLGTVDLRTHRSRGLGEVCFIVDLVAFTSRHEIGEATHFFLCRLYQQECEFCVHRPLRVMGCRCSYVGITSAIRRIAADLLRCAHPLADGQVSASHPSSGMRPLA